MLVPAILYKDEIIKNIQKRYYSDDMFYLNGWLNNYCPDIAECPDRSTFQFAVVNKDKLIGYISYRVDYYTLQAFAFSMISFDRGNLVFVKDIFNKLEELVNSLHRVEWNAVSSNPACNGYDNFIKKHNGSKFVLTDYARDAKGNYCNGFIYQIINDNVKNNISRSNVEQE